MSNRKVVFLIGSSELMGASRMACFYARSFLEAGVQVVGVCGSVSNNPEVRYAQDIFRKMGCEVEVWEGFSKLLDWKLVWKLQRLLKEKQPMACVSFVQNDVKIGALASAFADVPFIVSAQNMVTFGGTWMTQRAKEGLYGWMMREMTRRIFCTSQAVERELAERFGVAKSKLRRLPNGIDLARFPRKVHTNWEVVRKELDLFSEHRVLINVGRLDEQKGQLILLEAFEKVLKEFPNTKLVLVGGDLKAERSAAYAKAVFAKAKEIGDRVVMMGWRNDIPDLLHAADVYVHSALWEGFPLAMLEAMASRLPFIGTNCTGMPEGFQQGVQGYLVPKGDALALAEAMKVVLSLSEQERAEMAQNGRQFVAQNYNVRELGKQFVWMTMEAAAR